MLLDPSAPLKSARQQLGLSQYRVSVLVGRSTPCIHAAENTTRTGIGLNTLTRYLRAMNLRLILQAEPISPDKPNNSPLK
jgi:hypothetical protein